jgi:hypothetical protein
VGRRADRAFVSTALPAAAGKHEERDIRRHPFPKTDSGQQEDAQLEDEP